MNTPEPNLELQVGGAINPRKHLYIVREDVENNVFQLLQRSEYCNILSSRQVGKSSLMIKVAMRLQQQEIRVVSIDIAGELGRPENAEQWYLGFLGKIVRSLRINLNVKQWWHAQEAETVNQRLLQFFRTELFAADQSPVVIFVDEIDHSLNLPYTDDFFTAIRTMYNQRATEPAFEKIAFCLIGVASPDELIKQRRTTAYNVGETLELRDFDIHRDDLSRFVGFLSEDEDVGRRLLEVVLDWTGGQPYLTTWLCREVKRRKLQTGDEVAQLVGEAFSNIEKVSSDVHFQQITRFLGERISDQLAGLQLYERILRGKTVRDEATQTHIELKLSGIVRRNEAGNLVVRNRIYQNVFDLPWVRQTKPGQAVRNLRRVAVAASILLVIVLSGVAYNQYVLEPTRANQRNATDLVNTLLVAEISKVATLTSDLVPYRQWADGLLRTRFQESTDPDERLRAGLALLPVDSRPVDYLREQLLTAPYEQVPAILDAISESNRAGEVISPLWETLESDREDAVRRLHAALAVARFEPPTRDDDSRWKPLGDFLSDQMIDSVIANPSHLPDLTQALLPVFPVALLDPLTQRFRSETTADRRMRATDILAEYAKDKPQLLAELILVADQPQFEVLFPPLAKHTNVASQHLQQILAQSAADDATDADANRLSSQQANAVIALLRMGESERVWSFLSGLPECATRSYLIARLARFGVEPERVVSWLEQQQDVSIRQILLLGLCQYEVQQIAAVGSSGLIDRLLEWYESDPDPSIHVTCQWLLRELNQEDKVAEISERLSESPVSKLDSFENGVGMTMVKLPAGPFTMGSPVDEVGRYDGEDQHTVVLTTSFYLAKHEVTQDQYQEIMDGENPSEFKNAGPNAPVERVSWDDATEFCRRLTERDRTSGKLPAGFVYELPTEAQWEYACRAGTTGAIYQGQLEILGENNAPALDPIAWYGGNSGVKYDGGYDSSDWPKRQYDHKRAGTHPVGQKEPNAWGLQDMLGNVWEWCRDLYGEYPMGVVTDPTGPALDIRENSQVQRGTGGSFRVIRGGSWSFGARVCRAAFRDWISPDDRYYCLGFRVAAVQPAGQEETSEPEGRRRASVVRDEPRAR